ncbi:MAG: RNA pol sigma70 protein [Magnetococcales bacterium]|nr:RNA pol sigma70 protein [Magnetococcales bacterium]HIJ83564.1 sigma-70 family RNA polymerase sigma factor [Magnetococcales bacterium]
MKDTAKPVEDEPAIRERIRRCQTAEDPQAMEILVSSLLPMVVHLAGKYPPLFHDDLIQEGCMGLMQSVQRFDLSQPTRFSSFAYHYIRGRMLKFLNTKASVVRHPQGKWILCKSLDTPVLYDEDSVPLVELLQSRDPSPEDRLIKKDIRTRLIKAMDPLSPKEKMVIRQYFWESATLEEVGEKLGISRETVRRVGQESLKKIRHRLLQRTPAKGVSISALVKRRQPMKNNTVAVAAAPETIDLGEFPIIHFVLSTRQGKRIWLGSEVQLAKQAIQPDHLCVVRVDREIAVRSIVKLVRLLAAYLGIPRKNITVELTAP